MNILPRLQSLQRRYATAVKQKKSRDSIASEMVFLVLKQLRKEIREDRKQERAHARG